MVVCSRIAATATCTPNIKTQLGQTATSRNTRTPDGGTLASVKEARPATAPAVEVRERRASEQWLGQQLAVTSASPSVSNAHIGWPSPRASAGPALKPFLRAAPVQVQLSRALAPLPIGTAWHGPSKREPVGCFSRRGSIFHPELAASQRFRPMSARSPARVFSYEAEPEACRQDAQTVRRPVIEGFLGMCKTPAVHPTSQSVEPSASQRVAEGMRQRPWPATTRSPRHPAPPYHAAVCLHVNSTQVTATQRPSSPTMHPRSHPFHASPRACSPQSSPKRHAATTEMEHVVQYSVDCWASKTGTDGVGVGRPAEQASPNSPEALGDTGERARTEPQASTATSVDIHRHLEEASARATGVEDVDYRMSLSLPPMPPIMGPGLRDVLVALDELMAASYSQPASVA